MLGPWIRPNKPEEIKGSSENCSKTIEKTKKKQKKQGSGPTMSLITHAHSWPRSLFFLFFFSGFLDGFAMLPAGLFGLFWCFWFWGHLGRAAYNKYADADQHICLVYPGMVA